MAAHYYLPDHIYFCNVDGATIFLDVAQDRYSSLGIEQTKWFSKAVAENCATKAPQDKSHLLAKRLTDKGLLQLDAGRGKPVIPFQRERPSTSIFEYPETFDVKGRTNTLPYFVYSMCAAWLLERGKTFQETVEIVRSWNTRNSRGEPSRSTVLSLTSGFHSVAPLLLTSFEQCRFRSIVLTRFLSLYGVHTRWVFGVRTSPFKAHCWIEYDGIVLTDYIDITRSYQPIFQV